jgi:hypothetical protein
VAKQLNQKSYEIFSRSSGARFIALGESKKYAKQGKGERRFW